MTMFILLDTISPDTASQARHEADVDLVEEYAVAMRDGATFPPVVLFRDVDGTLRIGDGFHRVAAAIVAGLGSIDAEIRDGGARAALEHSIQSNARHGARFTNRDKRRIVGIMLNDPEWSQLPDREIGRRCGVSQPFVGKVRTERSDNGYQSEDALTSKESALLAECEAKIEACLPSLIFGELPIGSLDPAKSYNGVDVVNRAIAEVSPSTFPGYWHVSVTSLPNNEKVLVNKPVRENAIPVALRSCGYVSDDPLWATSVPQTTEN